MRCPDCNKFVSLETQDPEVSDLTIEYTQEDREFHITGTVRIVRNCGECGQELKEATLEIDQTVGLGEGLPDDAPLPENFAVNHDLTDVFVEENGVDIIEEGGGRYAKSYYGATVTLGVQLGTETVAEVQWSDKVAASAMDELV